MCNFREKYPLLKKKNWRPQATDLLASVSSASLRLLLFHLKSRGPCYCDDEPIIMAVCLINDPLVLFQQKNPRSFVI